MGSRKSSRRISPGWTGGSRLPVVTSAKSTRFASKSSRLMLMASSLVVVHDLDVPCGAVAPFEAYPPLIVDADAMFSASIAMQGLEAVAGRNPQIVELLGR